MVKLCTTILLILLTTAIPTSAQTCPELDGLQPLPFGRSWSVAASGTIAVYGSGSYVVTVDITDPAAPNFLNMVEVPSLVRGLAISGSVALVAAQTSGLFVIDISNPSSPVIIGSLPTTGESTGVTVVGTTAYVAEGTAGLRLVNISNPAAPVEINQIDTPGTAGAVAVSGGHAFVADGSAGLRVIRVLLPAFLTEVGSLDTDGTALDVHVVNTLALIADGGGGLRVIDIATPSDPTELGTYIAGGPSVQGVTSDGQVAYIACGTRGLRSIDISTPTQPTQLDELNTFGNSRSVSLAGSFVLVATDDDYSQDLGLRVVDVSAPTSLTEAAMLTNDTPGYLALVDGVAYAAGRDGLWLIDIVDPSAPAVMTYSNIGDRITSVTAIGNHLLVGENDILEVFDISTPSAPIVVAAWPVSKVRDIAIDGSHGYLATTNDGLRVVDLTDLSTYNEVGFFDPGADFSSVVVTGSHVVATTGWDQGLYVVDVTDPLNPIEAAFESTPWAAFGITIVGDHAYVAGSRSGLLTFNISDPTNPTHVATNWTSRWLGEVQSDGSFVYLTGYFNEFFPYDPPALWIFDVSTPGSPREVGYFPTDVSANAVEILDGQPYVTGPSGGLAIFDPTCATVLFEDGFDTGSTEAWTVTLP